MPRFNARRAAAALAIAAPLVFGGFVLGRHSADGGYRVFQAVMAIVSRDAVEKGDILVAAMNPTPDGKMPGESKSSPRGIQNCLGRISGRCWTGLICTWRCRG